jgi:CspA family cold shock protein
MVHYERFADRRRAVAVHHYCYKRLSMNTPGKLVICLVVSALASSIVASLQAGHAFYQPAFDPLLFAAILAASVLSVLLTSLPTFAARQPGAAAGSADPERESGKVKWFNVSKGFGFIIRDEGDEIFVHFRAVETQDGERGRRALQQGQRVTFRVVEGDRGPQADAVRVEGAV